MNSNKKELIDKITDILKNLKYVDLLAIYKAIYKFKRIA